MTCRHCDQAEHSPSCPEVTGVFPGTYAPDGVTCIDCPAPLRAESVIVRRIHSRTQGGAPIYVYACLSCAAQIRPEESNR